MTYSLDEGLEDARIALETLLIIEKRFPTAELITLPDGRRVWGAATIEPSGFDICIEKRTDTAPRAFLCPYEMLGRVPVFILPLGWQRAFEFFDELEAKAPAVYAELLSVLARHDA